MHRIDEREANAGQTVLVLAPHADDETLGCGGTIARLASEGSDVVVAVLTGHGAVHPHPIYDQSVFDRVRDEAKRAHACLGVRETIYRELPAAQLPEVPMHELNRVVHEVFAEVEPQTVFVPFPFDLHEDHRRVFAAASVAWRPTTAMGRRIEAVYAYETPSETHWNAHTIEPGFSPNVWMDISDHLSTKLEAFSCFESQVQEPPAARSLVALESLARWRGSQVHVDAAEAFVLVRAVR